MSTIDVHGSRRLSERVRIGVVGTIVLAMLAAVAATPQAASAAVGSRVSGVAWADVNRDGLRSSDEPLVAGVTMELLSGPAGPIIATTTSAANGTYAFTDVADGVSFYVRAVAPAGFRFPNTASGQNDFVRAGQPAAGQPERGITAAFAISGATQIADLDAGMQPLATIEVQPLAQANACDSLIVTGTPAFDASDGGGMDSGPSNCLVRTNDQTTQLFSVSLTGLPTGGSVSNVVLDITASSTDGARFSFTGPQASGLPTGCLTAGVSPASSITNNPDGTVTLHCNMGTFTSAVGLVQVPVTPLGNSLNNSHFHLTANARAAGGDAASSSVVTNPDVQVTGLPRWDVAKGNFGSTAVPTVDDVQLRTALDRVLHHPEYTEGARRLAEASRRAGGYLRAAAAKPLEPRSSDADTI